MHIFAIHLSHFRRFQKLSLYPNPALNLLVGPNNSGKTALLRALDLVLNPANHPQRDDLIGQFDFHRADVEKPIEIWIYFAIPESDPPDIHARFGDKMSRWLLDGSGRLVERPFVEPDELPFEPAIKQPMEREPASSEGRAFVELMAVRFSASTSENGGNYALSWEILDEVGGGTPLTAEDRRAIGFTSIPADRRPVQMLGFARRNLLGKLLDDTEVAGPLRQLLTGMEQSKGSLTQTESLQRALESVRSTLKDFRLLDEEGDTDVTVTFLSTEISRLRSSLELAFTPSRRAEDVERTKDSSAEVPQTDVRKPDFAVPLSYQGDGLQNALLLASLAAAQKSKGTLQTIGAIEEPERSLEPWRVKGLFKKLAREGQPQLLVTTHSPAIIGEIKGADNLVILVSKATGTGEDYKLEKVEAVACQDLPDEAKKDFERFREAYARCLFSRLVLVVEGDSEMGFLPVALAEVAKKQGGPDLVSLGLEFFNNVEGKRDQGKRAARLRAFGRRVAVLLDHDESQKGEVSTEQRLVRVANEAESTLIWCRDAILNGALGCDLEVILAEGTPIESLAEAVKGIYSDPGHDIDPERWKSKLEKLKNKNPEIWSTLPNEFPDPSTFDFSSMEPAIARLTLFALMHAPHDMKSARDMRRVAETLQSKIPKAVTRLYDRLRELLEGKQIGPANRYYDLWRGKFADLK